MQESFWLESRGSRMLCILEHSTHSNVGENLVVLIHGFAGTKVEPHRMYKKLSKRLSDDGFTVLRFDFVGSGDSDGDFEDMTIRCEIEDSFNVIEYCRNKFNVKKLFIHGYSMGGCIASCVAASIENNGLVLWSPVSSPYWNFYHLLGKDKFMQGLKGENVDYLGDIIGSKFFKELIDINPLEKAEYYNKPVFIIHGTQDNDVLPLNAYSYSSKFHNCNIHFIENADHCYTSKEWEDELLSKTEEFFKTML